MTNGTVKFFNAAKGFGFITPDDGGKDVFVPAASVTASGIVGLKPGQRVSFEEAPDSKGPKAINLKVLAEPPKPQVAPVVKDRPAAVAADTGRAVLTVYHDPDTDESETALAVLRDAGHDPRLVDYIATPPTRDELKNLSLLLRDGDQSLVRKYDPLFQELRLDDRFISENEFWTGIFEHPSLINGPVIATRDRARICRTENAVRSFLGIEAPREVQAKTAPKAISGGIAALMTGSAPATAKEDSKPAKSKPVEAVPSKAAAAVKPRASAKAKPDAAPKAKAATSAKKAAPKPVKKAVRAKSK